MLSDEEWSTSHSFTDGTVRTLRAPVNLEFYNKKGFSPDAEVSRTPVPTPGSY